MRFESKAVRILGSLMALLAAVSEYVEKMCSNTTLILTERFASYINNATFFILYDF